MMKKIIYGIRLLLLSILFNIAFVSCESEKLPKPEVTDAKFSENIIPIFEQKCNQCHGGDQSPDLSPSVAYLSLTGGYLNLESPANSSFYQTISGNGSMASKLNDQDRAYILKWIELGALEN